MGAVPDVLVLVVGRVLVLGVRVLGVRFRRRGVAAGGLTEVSLSSANATAGVAPSPIPTPRANARAPIRPMYAECPTAFLPKNWFR